VEKLKKKIGKSLNEDFTHQDVRKISNFVENAVPLKKIDEEEEDE